MLLSHQRYHQGRTLFCIRKKLGQVVTQTLLTKLNRKNDDIREKIERKWLHERQEYRSGTLIAMQKITSSTYLQALHYRLVNRILPTNTFLLRAGLSESSLCTFCDSANETLGHLFSNCQKVRAFFIKIKALLGQKYSFRITVEQINRIFPDCTERNIIGLIMIITIQCIWFARLEEKEPEVRRFESLLKNHHLIEKFVCKVNDTYDQWYSKWDGLHSIEQQ